MESDPEPLTASLRGIRSYVIRAGRMTEAQREAYERLAPAYCIPYAERTMDRSQIFPRAAPLFVEIGFGMGIATWGIARSFPENDYLGIEVHKPGVGKLLYEIEKHGIDNLMLVHHDACEVVREMLAPVSIAGFHIFYPDPWPKKRHHKRRLISEDFVSLLVSRLVPGGYIYFVTDIEEYAEWSYAIFEARPELRNPYLRWAPPRSWRPETKFQHKATAAGRRAFEIWFEKNAPETLRGTCGEMPFCDIY